MNHLGFFAGIGGFELAARWMGWKTIAWVENNPFCQKVLRHNFPGATGHDDIKTTYFKPYAGKTDIATGGFPCQPYSKGGKQKGKFDERHLWPEMLRGISEAKPRWVVGENVPGIINWGGGLVFNEVQADLEAEGYEVQPFILPSCGVNQIHRRERVWFVAYSHKIGSELLQYEPAKKSKGKACQVVTGIFENGNERDVLQRNSRNVDGLPAELDSIGAYGNAISPYVAFQIFKAIEQYEKLNK